MALNTEPPTVKVELAFDNSPSDPVKRWTDITDNVLGFSSKRGRNTELDSMDAGTASLVLDNADGLFTPRRVPTNLVGNPSLEGGLDGWTIDGSGTLTIVPSSTYPQMAGRVGQNIAQMTAPSGGGAWLTSRYTIKPTAGKWIVAKAWLADDGGTDVQSRVELQINTAGGLVTAPYQAAVDHPLYSGGDFTTIPFQVPSDPDDSVVIMVGNNHTGPFVAGQRVWFDNVKVYQFDTEAEATDWANRPFHVRPRTPVRVTATFNGVTYPIAYGIVERWPLDLSDSAPVMTVPVVDMSKLLSDTYFANSDTGQLQRLKPVDYFPMQEDKAPLASVVTKRVLQPSWDGSRNAPKGSEDNPLPEITYDADSNLPSETGTSVDLGGYWAGTE